MVRVNAYPLVVSLGSKEAFGASTGLYYFFVSLAATMGPPVVGSVMDLFGEASMFGFIAVMFFAAYLCMVQVARISPDSSASRTAA